MGVVLSNNGTHQGLIEQVCSKFTARTGELVRWSHVHHVTLDLLCRLWLVYIKVSALWGAALCHLKPSQMQSLLLAQRKAGRLLLGHSRQSPNPTPCVELGWPLIGTWLQDGRLRLLARILASTNDIVSAVAAASLEDERGWMATEVSHARNFAPEGLPRDPAAWQALFTAAFNTDLEADAAQLAVQCAAHPQLASYQPAVLTQEKRLGLNRMLHDSSIGADEARVISRLLSGGQGLRGRDPLAATPVSPRTACLACLLAGYRRKETLQHFLFECPLTEPIRCDAAVAACWAERTAVTLLHRDVWSFTQLRTIRHALLAMWQARIRLLDGHGLQSKRRLNDRLGDMWLAAV